VARKLSHSRSLELIGIDFVHFFDPFRVGVLVWSSPHDPRSRPAHEDKPEQRRGRNIG